MATLTDGFKASRVELQYDHDKLPQEVADLAERLQSWETDRITARLGGVLADTGAGGTSTATFQGHKHHEFTVEEHLKHASYVIGAFSASLLESPYVKSHYEGFLFPAFSPQVQEKIGVIFDLPADEFTKVLKTAQVAAYLHDIEKIVLPKRIGDQYYPVLTDADMALLGIRGYDDHLALKSSFINWLTGETSAEPRFLAESSIKELRGIVSNTVDIERLRGMLAVYFAIDKRFIADGEQIVDDPEIYQKNLNEVTAEIGELGVDKVDVVFGALIMMADNVAQGVPPQATARFERDLARYACFCNDLIDRIV